jgi:hypothetical protein
MGLGILGAEAVIRLPRKEKRIDCKELKSTDSITATRIQFSREIIGRLCVSFVFYFGEDSNALHMAASDQTPLWSKI